MRFKITCTSAVLSVFSRYSFAYVSAAPCFITTGITGSIGAVAVAVAVDAEPSAAAPASAMGSEADAKFECNGWIDAGSTR